VVRLGLSMSALLMCLNEMRRHDDFRLSLRALLHH
jgi:hypothetical protein